MNKAHGDNRVYQRKRLFSLLLSMYMFCVVSCMTGCGTEELLDLTKEELLQQTGEGVLEATRTLSLEELEKQAEDSSAGEPYSISSGDSLLYEGGSSYARERLSGAEQIWYDDIKQAMGKVQEKVKLSQEGLKAGLDETHVDRIFQSVLDDHPELFYVEGYSYTKYTRGNKTVALEFSGTYNRDKDTVYAHKQEIEEAVAKIIAPAVSLEDDYEKIKYVYEELITDTEYLVDSEDNQNIYSVFVNKKSVCQGYAKAFQYLMYRLDVDCTLVQGTVVETGEGHAWNLVCSNGTYYYVDPTWGDITYQNAQNNAQPGEDRAQDLPGVSYDYLCITSKQLFRTHQVKTPDKLPVCEDLSDNYYVREGAYFTVYDEEKMAALVERRLAENCGEIALMCSDETCFNEMKTALLDRQELFGYLAGSGIQSFVYSCNESQYTLTFFMMTS